MHQATLKISYLHESIYRHHHHTALIRATYNNFTECAKLLLKNDQIDVNIKEDNGGYTALIISAYHNNTECVKLLLENDKIDVGAKGTNGYTALMMAEANDSTECVKLLS